jgi:peptidoglycan/xylan/chitin deacetylase (PgdA/CDA1 family)
VIRPQTLLVILIIVMVLERGSNDVVPATSLDVTPTAEVTSIAMQPEPTSTVVPVSTPTATISPSPTPEPTATPTPEPTEAPAATERPVPPDTGQSTSLVVERGDSGRLEVAFTFDAGEGRGYTEEILDLFAEYGLVGSFGITGEWAEANPDLMQRIVNEGHQIINHTWDHASFTGNSTGLEPLTEEERREQVERTEQAIADTTGGYQSSPFFRFPYGDYDLAALELLGEMGFDYTMWWSCDTLAWQGDAPDVIVDRCGVESDNGGPGAILLMHVAQEADWNALEPLILDYLDAGYELVTIEQVIQP